MCLSNSETIKVWDPFVRIFHWFLVMFFFLAYFTEDDWMIIHSYAGYTVTLLVMFRLLWGFLGTSNARFNNFITSFQVIKTYITQLFSADAKHYIGHNPAGGLMIVILLLCLFLTAISGILLFATEGYGPLAETIFAQLPEDILEETHEFFANFTVLMVVIHVAGVLVSSFLHDENLIKSMITGNKNTTATQSKNEHNNIVSNGQ